MKIVLRFRSVDKGIFDAVRAGKKKVETRANTIRYKNATKGDILVCLCAGRKFQKVVRRVRRFKNPVGLLRAYTPTQILPGATRAELLAVYNSFYKNGISNVGIVAFELE